MINGILIILLIWRSNICTKIWAYLWSETTKSRIELTSRNSFSLCIKKTNRNLLLMITQVLHGKVVVIIKLQCSSLRKNHRMIASLTKMNLFRKKSNKLNLFTWVRTIKTISKSLEIKQRVTNIVLPNRRKWSKLEVKFADYNWINRLSI